MLPLKRRSRSEASSERFEAQLRNVPAQFQPLFRSTWIAQFSKNRRGTPKGEPWERFLEWVDTDEGQDELARSHEKMTLSDKDLDRAELEHHARLRGPRKLIPSASSPFALERRAALGEVTAAKKAKMEELRALAKRCREDIGAALGNVKSASALSVETLEDARNQCAIKEPRLSKRAARRVCQNLGRQAKLWNDSTRQRAQQTLAVARGNCTAKRAEIAARMNPHILRALDRLEAIDSRDTVKRKKPTIPF